MAIVAYHLVSGWPTRVYRPHCAVDETGTVSEGAPFAWMESAYSCRAFGRSHGTSRLVRRYRWVYHSRPTVSCTMREIHDLGMPNNDSRSHKRFGYANRHSTMHIASNLEKTYRFGTTITSGRPNSLASLTMSFFTKRNITRNWSSLNACRFKCGHARS